MRSKNIFLLIVVILSAFFWTFVNYQNRWTLSEDQARDAIIGLYSLQKGFLPPIGPPSSLGFFSFGPFYYWLIILFSALAPNVINAPWIGFSLFSILEVVLFYLIGEELGGKKLGFIFGLVSSFSSARVFHSVDLLNPVLVPFFTTLSFLSLIKLFNTKKAVWAFLLSSSITLAINFHFQALGLLSILALLFIPYFKTGIKKNIVWVFLGLLIPFLPIILFYSHHPLPIHSLTPGNSLNLYSALKQLIKDIAFTWPNLFGEALFFTPRLGYPVILGVLGIFIWICKKRISIPIPIQIIIVSLLIQALFLPFYYGERTPVYLLVFHPYIILIACWLGWILYKRWQTLGYVLFGAFILISTWSNLTIIRGYTQRPLISQIKQTIDNQTNGKNANKISLYEAGNSDMVSLPLFYLYLKENRISETGFALGSCAFLCPTDPVPFLVKGNYSFYNLQNVSAKAIPSSGFKKLTQQSVYNYLLNYYIH